MALETVFFSVLDPIKDVTHRKKITPDKPMQ